MKPLILAYFLFLITQVYCASRGGLLSRCVRQTDCESPLICSATAGTSSCPISSKCRCHPSAPSVRLGNDLVPCETENECPPGHSCFTTPDGSSLACIAVSGDSDGVDVGVGVGTGVTFDVCKRDDDCSGGRSCRLIRDNDVSDCEGRLNCVCVTPEPIRCSRDDECDEREMCADTVKLGLICASSSAVESGGVDVTAGGQDVTAGSQDDEQGDDEQRDDEQKDDDQPIAGDQSSGNGTALVLEACTTSNDCLPPRQCLDINNDPNVMCPETASNACVCGYLEIPPCTNDSDCAEGETCTQRDGSGHDFCISKSVISSGDTGTTSSGNTATSPDVEDAATNDPNFGEDGVSSNEPASTDAETTETGEDTGATSVNEAEQSETGISEAVCVDVELLTHLPASQLVFSKHRVARVWCDGYGSCGTAGHMVKWDGRVMMMRSYCEEVGCEESVKLVNSPRYRRGGWVRSRSRGLVFMTLAARFESRVEELVLSAAVRVGL